MPVKVYKRGAVYHYRGTVSGRRLRGSTGTADKERAERIAATKETELWKYHNDGPGSVLTFAKASILYRAAGKQVKYLTKIEDYWKDTLVKDIRPGTIKQMAIDIYPKASPQTRNRQAITPCQAVINHCAELEMCPPIRVKRFDFEEKIKQPIMLDWLDIFCAHARPVISALATFMFSTACRISEARRLDWPDINFQQKEILVVKSKNKKQRLPHMPPRLLVALSNLPRDDKPFGCWSESSLRRFWDEDVEKTAKAVPGFKRLTFHSCRHGFATTMLRTHHRDPKTAAWLGGWDDITLFMRTYAHAIQDATLTNTIFDPPQTQQNKKHKKNKALI